MFKTMKKLFAVTILSLLVLPLWVTADNHITASVSPLPVKDGYVHNGVASCASSTCHGSATQNNKTNIQHNEYVIWDRRDVHSRAYNKLFNSDFLKITEKLGLKAPHEEPVCLACHASNIDQSLRGKKFQMSDGIGCETCHGGSEKWLKNHTNKKTTHAQNLENGLYPASNIVNRARLCLSCHYGNEQQFVTHELMGAGHPRISFELDTFTEIQPKHFTQDEDYAERKTPYSNVKAWAVGQAVAAESMLAMFLSDNFHSSGLFPELSMFDCHSCHHPMSDKTWQPKKGVNLKPGSVPFNDSSLLMLRHVIAQLDKTRGWHFKQNTLALHTALTENPESFRKQVIAMHASMPDIIKSIMEHEFTPEEIKRLANSILNEGIWDGYNDYVVAEQSVMALTMLTISWDSVQAFDTDLRKQIYAIIDKMYVLVKDDEDFNQQHFRESLLSLRKKLPE